MVGEPVSVCFAFVNCDAPFTLTGSEVIVNQVVCRSIHVHHLSLDTRDPFSDSLGLAVNDVGTELWRGPLGTECQLFPIQRTTTVLDHAAFFDETNDLINGNAVALIEVMLSDCISTVVILHTCKDHSNLSVSAGLDTRDPRRIIGVLHTNFDEAGLFILNFDHSLVLGGAVGIVTNDISQSSGSHRWVDEVDSTITQLGNSSTFAKVGKDFSFEVITKRLSVCSKVFQVTTLTKTSHQHLQCLSFKVSSIGCTTEG